MIGVSRNPTALTVGKTGTLGQHRATVVGRAVLRSADRYRWHEYYVRLDGGRMIVLVYESGVWKRFEEFTPKTAITAAEAVTYRVGDFLTLRSTSAQVKYISTSCVVYAEGQTLDGVRTGSEARYFNAESDGAMIVVSWTGDEIEFYTGARLASFVVPHAFKLPEPSFWKKLTCDGSGGLAEWLNPYYGGIALLVICFAFLAISSTDNTSLSIDPPPVAAPPALQLAEGRQGTLAGEHFIIRGHALIEIDEVGRRFQSYEYDLIDDQGGHALLVEHLNDHASDWVLFRTATAPDWLKPDTAATVREGANLQLGARDVKVQRLLLSRTIGGAGPATEPVVPGTIRYGFLAQSGDTSVLARWSEQTLDLEQGQPVPESAVRSAFDSSGG